MLKKHIFRMLLLASITLTAACSSLDPNGYPGGLDPLKVTSGSKWTILVYMDGDNNLEENALADLNEMEAVNLAGSGVRIVALADRAPGYTSADGDWKGARLYEVQYDKAGLNGQLVSKRIAGMGLKTTGEQELNMGDPDTLKNFVAFGKQNYPADHIALVFWDHGGGWRTSVPSAVTRAVCWDESSGNDCLTMSEVKKALLASLSGTKLDVIGFDACLMGMLEVAYQLKDVAKTMVASEETEPGDGWDYRGFLQRFIASSGSAADFGKSAVASYGKYYGDQPVTLAALDLGIAGAVCSDLDAFVTNRLMRTDKKEISGYRTKTQKYYNEAYLDLAHFAGFFQKDAALKKLTAELDKMVLAEFHGGGSTGNSHGLSIYFPSSPDDPEYGDYQAGVVDMHDASLWDEFLEYYCDNGPSLVLFPDNYESDQTPSKAKSIAVTGKAQDHTLDTSADIDWNYFQARAGYAYQIVYSSPDGDILKGALYASGDTATTLMNGAVGKNMEFTCKISGKYLIKTTAKTGKTGSYTILVKEKKA